MIELVVFRALGGDQRISLGVHRFEIMPHIGHEIEIIEPEVSGKIVRIIHSTSKAMQQTEIVIQVD